VQEGKVACARFPPRWVVVLVQEGKLARARFSPWWDDVV